MKGRKPIVGISAGDPSGIGPEVVVKALLDERVRQCCRPLVLCDARVLDRARRMLRANIEWRVIHSYEGEHSLAEEGATLLDFNNVPSPEFLKPQPDAACGRASVEYVEKAIDLAMAGKIDAIATAPINKESIGLAGYEFAGHTEILAERTHTPKKVMMLAGGPLRVALVTIHIGLAQVPKKLTTAGVLDTIQVTHDALAGLFGIAAPRIAVCGLNPHAGESGRFGDEEARIIEPAVSEGRNLGIDCTGPYPADTVFYRAAKGAFDAVVAMYHDQGLIPLKLIAFESAVNITLGLPIIRTSVDHGTAFDIAGKGVAHPDSMIEAIKLAALFATQKKGNRERPDAAAS
ncbi:MAG TPA: 4-hydroxythreonine-4-phosphate dehydrogenase PdxA [Planctomycetota bacterium]|nr:4-hydroxythreonine-4-phosphate dehydrogenase PdxA [Planctomycetota bacterium]